MSTDDSDSARSTTGASREEVREVVEEVLEERKPSSTRRQALKGAGLLGAAGLMGETAGAASSSSAGTMSVGSVTANTYRIAADLYGGPASARSELEAELGSGDAGAKYRAEDTGGWYHWNGSAWNLMPIHTEELFSDRFAAAYGTDAQAVRDAFAAAPQGGVVTLAGFPEVTNFSTTIDADAGARDVSLISRQLRRTLRLADGADTTLLQWTGGDDSNMELHGFKLEGNKSNQTSAAPLLLLETSADEHLKEVWINRSKGVGLKKTGGFGWLIDHCYIEGHDSWGIEVDSSSANTSQHGNGWIRDTKVTGNLKGIHIGTGVPSGTIENCKLTTVSGATDSVVWIESGNWTVENKKTTGKGAYPAMKFEANDCEVRGGEIEANDTGVDFAAGKRGKVHDVTLDVGSIGVFVEFGVEHAVVSDINVVSASRGVVAAGSTDHLSVNGGTITGCTDSGIDIAGAYSSVAGTTLTECSTTSGDAICWVKGAGSTVSGVSINQPSGVGVADGLRLAGAGSVASGVSVTGADIGTALYVDAADCQVMGHFEGDVTLTANSNDCNIIGTYTGTLTDNGTGNDTTQLLAA